LDFKEESGLGNVYASILGGEASEERCSYLEEILITCPHRSSCYHPTMDLILEPRDGVLLATASGQLSFHEAVQSCGEICDMAAGLGLRKIVVDCLAVEGDLSPDERFELGRNVAEFCQNGLTIFTVALIGKPPAVTGLGARAASNRGMPVEIFSDRQQGLDWLRSRP